MGHQAAQEYILQDLQRVPKSPEKRKKRGNLAAIYCYLINTEKMGLGSWRCVAVGWGQPRVHPHLGTAADRGPAQRAEPKAIMLC